MIDMKHLLIVTATQHYTQNKIPVFEQFSEYLFLLLSLFDS